MTAAGGDAGKPVSEKGQVPESPRAFAKGWKKPLSAQCARACARAGSPLAIVADNGAIDWPIAGTTPSSGQNKKLMPFARDCKCQPAERYTCEAGPVRL